MYSQKNSLKVWVSNASGPSIAATLAALPAGEIGFFDALGAAIATTGTGYMCYRKPDGQVLMSKLVTFSSAWKSSIVTYSAPTQEVRRLVIPTPAASTLYQIRVEMKWPGMQGEYIKHANYVTGSVAPSAADLATALRLALTNSFNREDKDYFTIGGSSANVDLTTKQLVYVRGKKTGRPVKFRMSLISPTNQATADTQVTPPSDGNGYGPYVCEQEFFAQGNSDPMRFAGYPNSFDDRALAGLSTGCYQTLSFTENTEVETTNGKVVAPQQYLLVFNTVGVGVVPIVSAADDSDNAASGTCYPNDIVSVYVNGTLAGTDNTTSGGTWSYAGAIVAGDIVTAKSTPPNGGGLSAASNAFTAVA